MPDIKTVSDRTLPTALDKECTASQEKGRSGKGMNEQTMPESISDFNQGPDITE